MDEFQAFPLIYSIQGFTWKADQLPGKMVSAEEFLLGDIIILTESNVDFRRFAIYLGAEEVLWVDNRIRISNVEEWLSLTRNIPGKQLVLKTCNILN